MMQLKIRRFQIVIAGLLLIGAVIVYGGYHVQHPVYAYYGQSLTAAEFAALLNQEVSLYCLKPGGTETLFTGQLDYICFNTQAEVDQYAGQVAGGS